MLNIVYIECGVKNAFGTSSLVYKSNYLFFSVPEVPGLWPVYGCLLQSTKTVAKTYFHDRQMGGSRSQFEGVRILVFVYNFKMYAGAAKIKLFSLEAARTVDIVHNAHICTLSLWKLNTFFNIVNTNVQFNFVSESMLLLYFSSVQYNFSCTPPKVCLLPYCKKM
jgi:hypothetical protein